MNLDILLAVWGVSLLLALTTIAVIARPLMALLTDICDGEGRARFWTLYADTLIVMAPLLVVSAPGLLDAAAAKCFGAVLQRAVFWGLGGIILSLLVMGYAVWKPVLLTTRQTAARWHSGELPHGPAELQQ